MSVSSAEKERRIIDLERREGNAVGSQFSVLREVRTFRPAPARHGGDVQEIASKVVESRLLPDAKLACLRHLFDLVDPGSLRDDVESYGRLQGSRYRPLLNIADSYAAIVEEVSDSAKRRDAEMFFVHMSDVLFVPELRQDGFAELFNESWFRMPLRLRNYLAVELPYNDEAFRQMGYADGPEAASR